jgi:hypothetical protein
MKSNLLAMLREGVEVEKGRFTAKLATRFGRPVPWKQAFIEELGQEAADELKRSYRVHTYYEVEVKEYAVLPLWQGHEEDEEGSAEK